MDELDSFKTIKTQKNIAAMKAPTPSPRTFWDGIKAIWEFTIGDLLRIFNIFKEISNYLYVGRVIRQHIGDKTWNKFLLRKAYFNVIYTVVNLPVEVQAAEEIYWKTFVIENIKPLNDYLATLNLQDVVRLKMISRIRPDDGVYAYVIKYIPLFRDLTWGWVFKWVFIFFGSWWIQHKYQAFTHCLNGVMWLVHLIK